MKTQRQSRSRSTAIPAATLLAALSLGAGSLLAQTSGTWTATTGGDWSNIANWNGGAGPVATGGSTSANVTATFSASGTQTVNLDTNQTVHTVAFSTGTYTLSSNNGSVLTLAGTSTPIIASTGTISASLAGTQGFTMNPGGIRTLTLSGNNTYSGVTTLTNGNLIIRANNALGATGTGNGLVVTQNTNAAPQLHLANNITTSEDITLRMNQTGAAAGTLVGSNLLYNDGGTNTLGGNVVLDRTGASSTNHIHWFGVQVTAPTSGSSILNLTGNISGAATSGQPSGTYADPTRLQLKTTTSTALIAHANLSGVISNGTLTTGGLSVYTATDSTGIVRLSGANTYTGSTVHQKGTLLINNTTGSGTGFGSVNVASTAIFGGTGTIAPTGANTVTFASGSFVAPGDVTTSGLTISAVSAGQKLTFDLANTTGGVTFASGAAINLDIVAGTTPLVEGFSFLGTSSGGTDAVFNNNIVNFSITGGILADGLYTLAAFDSANAYSGQWVIGSGLSGYTNAALVHNANGIYLQIGAIPEPSAFAMLGGVAALGLAAVRRRRR